MLVRYVGGPFRHDSYLLVLWFEDCLTFVVFRTVHQTTLAHANVPHFDTNISLEVATGGVQLVRDVLRRKEALQNTN